MNFNRFRSNLDKFGGIGKTENAGINRLAFSKEYYEAIDQLATYGKSKGFDTKIDKVGNLFISYNPNDSSTYFMLGFHMDTVKSGGLYDGALGCMAALEILESLKEEKIDMKYGALAVFFNAEEGSEMGGTFGSRTIANRNDLLDPSLADKLKNYNLTIEDLKASVIDFNEIIGFLELHIEQGGVLEEENLDIAIVDGIVGITRYDIIIKGEANHAGTTPMDMRNDPIRQLPGLIESLYENAKIYPHPFVMTVGDIRVQPGMYNIIPDSVKVMIEVRDMDQANIDEFFTNINNYLNSNVEDFKMIKNVEKPSVKLDKDLMDIVEESCQKLEYDYKVMASGAGHDAKEISHLIPSGLIFVPSIGGISHSPKEFTRDDQLEKGVRLMYETVKSIVEVD